MKSLLYFGFSVGALAFFIAGCGVKGRPTVPEYPPAIGKGIRESQSIEAIGSGQSPKETLTPTPRPQPVPNTPTKENNKKPSKVKK